MTETAISPLRRRMLEDMKIRGIGQKTQEDYIRAIRNFTRFFGASPDKAEFEDLRRYQLHMRNEGIGAATINSTLSALRFLFKVTLRRAEAVDQLRYVRQPRKLPVVLSHEEVARLLAYAPGLKYKAALSIAYGAGLRTSEVVNLRVSDIDSERMVIRVEQGKGRRDRYAMLSPQLLDVLRVWWREGRPTTWLFPGQGPLQPLSARQLNRACHAAALGGHVAACEDCGHGHIAYNSCRNRHCPTCQGSAAEDWLNARKAELLPVPYYHVVFTLPSLIADIAYQNKAVIYDLLFKAAAETLLTIAADPKHLGARIGIISVLHTWGSAMTHHPHVHMIVPGGGLTLDGKSWIACKPGFFIPVRVLSMLFRRLMLEKLQAAHHQGKLRFFGDHERLCDKRAFAAYLAPLKKIKWFVYSKEPFKGPAGTLAYLGRYTHRVAIANNRLIKTDNNGVTFHYKDYRGGGRFKRKIMTIAPFEFIRRFLIHVLPNRFHRIRHYGLFANGQRAANLDCIRALLSDASPSQPEQLIQDDDPRILRFPCPACGGRMIIIDSFEPGADPPEHRTDTERINAA